MSVYIGDNAKKARAVVGIYVGVNGKAQRVKNAYVGINNRAKQCYTDGPKIWTWEEVFAAELDGTYSTKFKLGDIAQIDKQVFIDGGLLADLDWPDKTIDMQIVAFDTDTLSDDSGKAKISWVSNNCLYGSKMGSQAYDWASCDIRQALRTNVFSCLPADLQAAIKTVVKTYHKQDGTDGEVADTIWIPSMYELTNGKNTSQGIEATGVSYGEWFYPNDSATNKVGKEHRKKTANRTLDGITAQRINAPYWTRTMVNSQSLANSYRIVYSDGTLNQTTPYSSTGTYIPLGFCT